MRLPGHKFPGMASCPVRAPSLGPDKDSRGSWTDESLKEPLFLRIARSNERNSLERPLVFDPFHNLGLTDKKTGHRKRLLCRSGLLSNPSGSE
jgi:hypothetical protein